MKVGLIDPSSVPIDAEMSANLVAPFAEEEIWNAIKCCDGNKAPGPYDFNIACIKKGWEFLKGLGISQ